MNLFFLALLGLYVAFAVATNRLERGEHSKVTKTIGSILNTPLFVMALVYAARHGVFSRQLVSPVYIAAGLLAGHLIFGVSLLATHRSFYVAAEQLIDLGALWRYFVDHPKVGSRFVAVAVGEELIYRVAAQPMLTDVTHHMVASILLVAAGFCVVHRHFFRNPISQSIEFAGFAILLGVLYHWTGSAILVLVIHAVRNFEIAYLEHAIALEQAGDNEASETPSATAPDAPETT